LGTSGRETTHGSSNVLGATPVYTTMQKNIFAALKVGKYLTLGACRTIEDWVKYGTIIGSVCGALLLNWVALKVKKGVAAARRKMAVASLERSDRREKSA
jgi:translocon-associated protein subunit beta